MHSKNEAHGRSSLQKYNPNKTAKYNEKNIEIKLKGH